MWAREKILRPLRAERPHPSGGVREVNVYSTEQLAAIAAQRRTPVVSSGPGEIAARAFELFDLGISLREVVVQLRLLPREVAELHEQWLDFGGASLVISAVAQAELARFIGPFADVADLVGRVSEILGRQIEVSVTEGSPLDRASDAQVECAIASVINLGSPPELGPTLESAPGSTLEPT